MDPTKEAKNSALPASAIPTPLAHSDSISEIQELHHILKPTTEDIPSIKSHTFSQIDEEIIPEQNETLTVIGVLKENPQLTLNFLKGLIPGQLQANDLELLRHMDMSFFKEVLRDENDSSRDIKELGAQLRGYLPQDSRENLFIPSKENTKPNFSEVAHRIYTYIKTKVHSLIKTLTPAETKPTIKKIRGEKIREDSLLKPLPEKTLKRKRTPVSEREVSEFISSPKKQKISSETAQIYSKMGDLLTHDSRHRNTLYKLNRDKAVFASKKLALAKEIFGTDEKSIETFIAISRKKEVSTEDYQSLLKAIENRNLY